MNIQINKDWRITSDPQNFILEQRRVKGKESKKAGEEFYTSEGFYTTFDAALSGLVRRKLLDSPCESLEAVKSLLQALRTDIQAVKGAVA